MKALIALTASAVVHALVLGALGWDILRQHAPPAGEVTVTQLLTDADVAAFAGIVDAGPQPVL